MSHAVMTPSEAEKVLKRAPKGIWKRRAGTSNPWRNVGDEIETIQAERDDNCDGGWRVFFRSAVPGASKKMENGSIHWFWEGYHGHCWVPSVAAIDMSRYPHTCPRCQSRAYVGAGGGAAVDCTNHECPTKKR